MFAFLSDVTPHMSNLIWSETVLLEKCEEAFCRSSPSRESWDCEHAAHTRRARLVVDDVVTRVLESPERSTLHRDEPYVLTKS